MKMHKNCCHQSCFLAQICIKSFVGWGFSPDLTGEAYSASPNPVAGLRGGPREREGGRGGEKEGGDWK